MQREIESHDVVDRIEDREVLWRLFVLTRDCGDCFRRGLSSPLKITACLRYFEEYLELVASPKQEKD
jgi:hypothetical protein